MLTTCRHNNDWQAHQDERCERDNEEYDKWVTIGRSTVSIDGIPDGTTRHWWSIRRFASLREEEDWDRSGERNKEGLWYYTVELLIYRLRSKFLQIPGISSCRVHSRCAVGRLETSFWWGDLCSLISRLNCLLAVHRLAGGLSENSREECPAGELRGYFISKLSRNNEAS